MHWLLVGHGAAQYISDGTHASVSRVDAIGQREKTGCESCRLRITYAQENQSLQQYLETKSYLSWIWHPQIEG